MLKYQIKLTDDNFKQEELVWGEKYLAPDLSFVSGVTSQDYHLEKFNKLPLTNSLVNNTNSTVALESENVTRQGYVIIKNKQYEVNSGTVVDYSSDSEGISIDYFYLFLNGKYYYAYENGNFTIDNWLVEKLKMDDIGNINSIVVADTIEVEKNRVDDKYIAKIDTIVWIEDGIVSIDGNNYFFDGEEQINSSSKGGLKYYEDGMCLDASAITKCDDIEYHAFESANDYIKVTKFILTKQEEIEENFDKICFCKYFFYIEYKKNYLPINQEIGTNYFKCDVPKYLLGNSLEDDNYETVQYYVYQHASNEEKKVSGFTFDALMDYDSDEPLFVKIEDDYLNVEHDIMNANDGKKIAIYLDEDTSNMAIGDKIRFIDSSSTSHTQYVYSVSDYGFNSNDTNFILFNSKKYKVEKNICDKVVINGNEYAIDYINGKIVGKDCLVLIGDEKVPMAITNIDGGPNSAGQLTRYGKIIVNGSSSAKTVSYDITPYNGITIDSKRYIIYDDGNDSYVAQLDRSNEYTFVIDDIKGSSMVICSLDMNNTDFTDEFDDFISQVICKDVVDNQSDMVLYVKNKVFGVEEITQELAFQSYDKPTSSDDYFNLFENLLVFSKNGYIHIPLALSNLQGNNMLQDDIVQEQFVDKKVKEAINPIVDMEKDVYLPKYIENSDDSIKEFLDTFPEGKPKPTINELRHTYIGSYTDFHPIREIRLNPHFRTRNMDSWKINDDFNDIEVENDDNWFITDMHPYKDIIDGNDCGSVFLSHYVYNTETKKFTITPMTRNESLETLYETSDLIGLLNFTDDDVYYQKMKIAKSFLRLSYYDSVNPQTQSLLATSTVFMDEHKLFKTFIDNSRKNISDYCVVVASEYEENVDVSKGYTIRKISVLSEYLGDRKENREKYIKSNNQYSNCFKGVIIDDSHRIGSEFIINNKIETDTSSEGYYLYIFREYSENLTPKPIYMKIEFNHAGIGRTIPFIIPMRWEENADKDGNVTPIRTLTLNNSDIDILKKGIRLEDVYTQTYIPLYAVYDFKNKEYAYVFDDRYVSIERENVVKLNLFELKIQNEEIASTETEENIKKIQREITMKQQKTAKIDINENQFPQQ